MTLRRNDYIIIALACFFLGIFFVAQVEAGRKTQSLLRPENNAVIALEVAKLTENNANLRREIKDLTHDLEIYRGASESRQSSFDKYQSNLGRLSVINSGATSGPGITINIGGRLSLAQIVDLIDAIKNIGAEVVTVNGHRLALGEGLNSFAGLDSLEIKVLGNGKLLKSAVTRRGGIMEQLNGRDISIDVTESDNIGIESGQSVNFQYARIVVPE